MIDWSKCPAAESRPGKLGGAWVFRGTRVPVESLFANLSAVATVDDFLEWFEGIDREQIAQVLDFVAKEDPEKTLRASVPPREILPLETS